MIPSKRARAGLAGAAVAVVAAIAGACTSRQVTTEPAAEPAVIELVTGLATPPDRLVASQTGDEATSTSAVEAPTTGSDDVDDDDDDGTDGDDATTGVVVASPEEAATDALLAERLPNVERACKRRKALPCEASGDLDDDGAIDRVVRVKKRGGAAIGLAILWGHGGGDLLGAGRVGTWTTAVDGETGREAIPRDLAFLERWAIWPAYGPKGRRKGFSGTLLRGAHKFPAARVVGDGILIDGGDSAAVAHWDGKGWRLTYLGF